jgi:hypothetical protein
MSRILSIADPDRGKTLARLGQDRSGTAVAEPTPPVAETVQTGDARTSEAHEDVLAPYRRHPEDQWPREHRLTPLEVPLLSAVKLSWGPEVSLLNISSTGMLVETTARFTPGSVMEFQLCGPTSNLVIPARFVRTEVAGVDARSVKYRAAAAFTKGLPLTPFLRPDPTSTPKALAELLTHVLADIKRGVRSPALRAKFEQGLRRLVSARDIQIRDVVVTPVEGSESIYFTVPTAFGGSQTVLQATFEPGHELTKTEFGMLRSAATLAAVILEFERMP